LFKFTRNADVTRQSSNLLLNVFAGLKYEKENETDLKDKLDFAEVIPVNYPPGRKLLTRRLFSA